MQLSEVKQDNRLTTLWQYFDHLIELDNDDILFASSYVRGFLAVTAVEFGDDEQVLSAQLYLQVTEQLNGAKGELGTNDQSLVNDFWQSISTVFN